MKLYRGSPKNPMRLVTSHTTLTLREVGEPDRKVERKYETLRAIKRLFGFSIGERFYFGIFWLEKPKEESHIVEFNQRREIK